MHDTYLKMRGVAHDINGLMACAGLAAEQLLAHQDPSIKKKAEQIADAIDRVSELCRAQLAERQANSGVKTYNSRALESLLGEMTNIVASKSQNCKRKVAFDFEVEEGVLLRCSHSALFRILFNLTINASNAIGKHRGSFIKIKVSKNLNTIRFDVHDDGPGLPKHVLAYLYPRADASKPPKGPIGSGLITAVALARDMEGQLRLIETGHWGTHFRLSMPNGCESYEPQTLLCRTVPLTFTHAVPAMADI